MLPAPLRACQLAPFLLRQNARRGGCAFSKGRRCTRRQRPPAERRNRATPSQEGTGQFCRLTTAAAGRCRAARGSAATCTIRRQWRCAPAGWRAPAAALPARFSTPAGQSSCPPAPTSFAPAATECPYQPVCQPRTAAPRQPPAQTSWQATAPRAPPAAPAISRPEWSRRRPRRPPAAAAAPEAACTHIGGAPHRAARAPPGNALPGAARGAIQPYL